MVLFEGTGDLILAKSGVYIPAKLESKNVTKVLCYHNHIIITVAEHCRTRINYSLFSLHIEVLSKEIRSVMLSLLAISWFGSSLDQTI